VKVLEARHAAELNEALLDLRVDQLIGSESP